MSATYVPGPSDRVYVAATNSDDGASIARLYLCKRDGRECISGPATVEGAKRVAVAYHEGRDRVVVAASDTSSTLILASCSSGGDGVISCEGDRVSGGGQEAVEVSIAPTPDGVYVATQDNARNGRGSLFRCLFWGNVFNCSQSEITFSADDCYHPSLALDPENDILLVACQNAGRLGVVACAYNGTGCDYTFMDASSDTGYVPSLVLDTRPGFRKAYFAARHGSDHYPILYVCDLDQIKNSLSSCVPNRLTPDGLEQEWTFVRAGLDTVHDKIIVTSLRFKATPYAFTCNLDGTGCANNTLPLLPGSVTSLSTALMVDGPNNRIIRAYADKANDTGVIAISSPSVPPLSCPEFTLPNGEVTFSVAYPTWEFDVVSCEPSYGLLGPSTASCPPGASSWGVSNPTCVLYATAFSVTPPPLSVVIGQVVDFSLLDGAGGGTPRFTPFAELDGVPLPLTLLGYGLQTYLVEFTTPTTAGMNQALTVGLDGTPIATFNFTVRPDPFAGYLNASSPTGPGSFNVTSGVVGLEVGLPMDVVLVVSDAYGNPLVFNPIDVRDTVEAKLAVGASVTQLSPTLVSRPDGGVDVQFSLQASIADPEASLSVTYTGLPVPWASSTSPFPVAISCAPDRVLENGVCIPRVCGTNSVKVVLENGLEECVCDTGSTLQGRTTQGLDLPVCGPCPKGGVCARGLGPPLPAPGFYPQGDGSFVQCVRRSSCVGGLSLCAPGYSGYLCATCSPGFYSNSAGACVTCPSGAGGLFAGVLVAVVLVTVGVGLGVGYGVASKVRETGSGVALRTRLVPASASMLFVCVQVIGILAGSDFAWPSSAASTLNVANVANVDVNLFASECALASFHTKYAVSILIPVAILGLVMASVVCLKVGNVWDLGGVSLGTIFNAVLFTVAPLLYIPLARTCLLLFDCRRLPNGDFVLDADPGVACFDSAWGRVAWLSALGVVVFVLGLPGYFLWCITRRADKLLTASTFARFGTLYALYRLPFYWGGVAELGKRLAIVLVAVFGSSSVLIQIGLLLAVVLGGTLAVARFQPYYYPLYNVVDVRLSLILVVVLLLGGAAYADRASSDSDTFFLVAVILVLVVLVGVGIHALVLDVSQIISSRSSPHEVVELRGRRLARVLESEMRDMEGRSREAAADLVSVLTSRGGKEVEMMDAGV